MLPDFLFGSYKQYKTDTAEFTTWLVDTGRKCGYSVDPAFKGSDGTYTLPLKEFTTLAGRISRSAITLPAGIARSARRAIASRKRCHEWFGGLEEGGDDGSDAAHGYFIKVLEECLGLLVGEDDGGIDGGKASNSNGTTGLPELTNRFGTLEVEVPSNTKAKKVAISRPKPPPTDQQLAEAREAQIQAAAEHLTQSFAFHWFCFFEDATHIRAFCKSTWLQYLNGDIDLMAAAVTTNMAFDLVRNASDELLNAYPTALDTQDMPLFMFGVAAKRRGVGTGFFREEMADVLEWCLLLPTGMLREFVLSSSKEPGSGENGDDKENNDEQQQLEPNDPSSMSPIERYQHDKRILHNLLPGAWKLAKDRASFFTQDNFTEGVIYMMNVKLAPIWVAFAAQVLLDIHDILGEGISRPYQELRLAALRNKKIVTQMLDPGDLLMRQYLPLHEDLLERINNGIDCCLGLDTATAAAAGKKNPRSESERVALAQNPVLCGLLMFSMNLRMHDVGLVFARAAGGIMSGAYIYHLIQQQEEEYLQHSPPRWPDMDKFIEFHSERWVFVGGKPKNPLQGLKKLSIMFGTYNATGAAKSGLRGPRDSNPELEIDSGMRKPKLAGIPKEIRTAAPVSVLFKRRYGSERVDYSMDIVSELVREFKLSRENGKVDEKCSPSSPTRITFDSLSQIDLLTLLRSRLCAEEPRLIFNYVGLTVRSYDLLRSLRRNPYISGKLLEYCGSDYISLDLDLPLVVPFIFHNARACFEAGPHLKLGAGEVGFCITVLRAGDVLDGFLNRKRAGDVACRELRAFCRGGRQEREIIISDGGAIAPTHTSLRPVLKEGKDYYTTSVREMLDDLASADLEIGVRRMRKG